MPGMPVTMGQPVPGAGPNMLHCAHSGCSAYASPYCAAAAPMLSYCYCWTDKEWQSGNSVVQYGERDQWKVRRIHRGHVRSPAGYEMVLASVLLTCTFSRMGIRRSNLLEHLQLEGGEVDAGKLQRYLIQSGICGTCYLLAAQCGVLNAQLLEEKRITNLPKFMFRRTAASGSCCSF